jgi:3-isopropylmalate/(R)-2-methylmalate dehydratase small subunit
MEKFTVLHGRAAPIMRENIDTDAIISAQAMMGGQLMRPGEKLFTNWRYQADGQENPDFVLNRPRYRGARILVAGRNFGCGSSREHAVWALAGYGIRCVIAESFGEIFYDNSFQNGLLPAIVPAADAQCIAEALEHAADPCLTIDLAERRVALPDGAAVSFSVPDERREALLQGLDDLSFLLNYQVRIDDWLRQDRADRPWIHEARGAP